MISRASGDSLLGAPWPDACFEEFDRLADGFFVGIGEILPSVLGVGSDHQHDVGAKRVVVDHANPTTLAHARPRPPRLANASRTRNNRVRIGPARETELELGPALVIEQSIDGGGIHGGRDQSDHKLIIRDSRIDVKWSQGSLERRRIRLPELQRGPTYLAAINPSYFARAFASISIASRLFSGVGKFACSRAHRSMKLNCSSSTPADSRASGPRPAISK